jgi:hypothetical protein
MIPAFMKNQVSNANERIIEGMNKNRQKLKEIDLLVKTLTIKDVEANFPAIMEYIKWSSKEIQELYNNNEKLLKKTVHEVNRM